MEDSTFGEALQHTMDNTIIREIGCFTDEINKAKNRYFLTDIQSKKITNFFSRIDAKNLNEIKQVNYENAVLIVFDPEIQDNSLLEEKIRGFQKNKGHIAAIIINRQLSYLNIVDEVLGININQLDAKLYGTYHIFQSILEKLLVEVDKRVIHF